MARCMKLRSLKTELLSARSDFNQYFVLLLHASCSRSFFVADTAAVEVVEEVAAEVAE